MTVSRSNDLILSFDQKGKVELQREDGSTRSGFGLAGSIRCALHQLEGYRGSSPNPAELQWEIKLYKFILGQPDPEGAARAYLHTRNPSGSAGPMLTKRKAVERLGWTI